MGLTCYGNAVIQNLRHLSKLTWLLEEGKYNTLFKKNATPQRNTSQELTRAFAEVVQFLRKCKKGQSVRPGNLWKTIIPAVRDTLYEQFAHKTFHDSHEFYQLILETIHQSTIQEVDMKIVRPPPVTPRDALIHAALNSWQQNFSKEYSPFVHMFYGMYHQKLVCQCNAVSHRWEPFNSLKVPIPAQAEPCDIMAALKADLLHEETIDEYECNKCGPPRKPAKKSVSIWKLPLVLTMSVKRFANTGHKIRTPAMAVPAVVDFTPYFSEDSPEREATIHYTLRGIVDHHGNAMGGHYTAQCRNNDSGAWYRYDDDAVHAQPGAQFGESTYMMFFERA